MASGRDEIRLHGDPRGRRWIDRLPERLRSRWSARPSFGAFISPAAVHLVRYETRGSTVAVDRYRSVVLGDASAGAAAEALANLAEAEAGRGAEVSVAVSGFGVEHALLQLPPAPRDLLEPVVRRELVRERPGAAGGLIDFSILGGTETRTGAKQQNVLVAAVPPSLAEALSRTLERRGLRLVHLTVLPLVVQRLYDAYDRGDMPSLVLLLGDGMSAMAAFLEGRLRIVWEPLMRATDQQPDLSILSERIRQGVFYVGQEFRGRAVERLLLCVDPETELRLRTALAGAMAEPIEPFGPEDAEPGLLAAFGAALDAAAEGAVRLLPASLQRPRPADRTAQALAAAAAAVLIGTAGWWAGAQLRRAAAAEAELAEAVAEYERRFVPVMGMETVALERQAHAARTAFLSLAAAEPDRLQDVLRQVALSAGDGIRLDALVLSVAGGEITVTTTGVATAPSSAGAMRAVDRFFRQLPQRLPDAAVRLERLQDRGRPAADSLAAYTSAEVSFGIAVHAPLVRAPGPE